jgi:hypothetical protein
MTAIQQTIQIPESREVRFKLPETVPSGMVNVTLIFERFVETENEDLALRAALDNITAPNDIDEFYGCFKGKGIWEGESVDLIRKMRNEW